MEKKSDEGRMKWKDALILHRYCCQGLGLRGAGPGKFWLNIKELGLTPILLLFMRAFMGE